MNPWPFVIAAYAIVLGGSAALTIWTWRSMRAAEAFADQVTRR
jgi:hypothetical protein